MSPRSSRSRSPREDRRRNRSRTPLNGTTRYNDAGGPTQSHSARDSQQDRRVYVGNLSYEVKWPQLKDHMRSGIFLPTTFLLALSDGCQLAKLFMPRSLRCLMGCQRDVVSSNILLEMKRSMRLQHCLTPLSWVAKSSFVRYYIVYILLRY